MYSLINPRKPTSGLSHCQGGQSTYIGGVVGGVAEKRHWVAMLD